MNGFKNPLVNFIVIFVAAAILVILLRSIDYLPHPQGPDIPPPDRPEGKVPPSTPPSSTPDASAHLTMGNPSGATDDPANRDNYLMRKPYFALSYNNARGTPNWVSWRLQKSDLGHAPRTQFYPDPDLPKDFKHVTPKDYSGSGFDRGHLCPHSDRASTPEASHATFVMTNMIPQAPSVNQKAWADMEEYLRELVEKGKHTLYIVAGPQGQGGTGTQGEAETIGNGKVTVPAKCWKVVLVLEGEGEGDDAARVGRVTRLIAVVMPNEESVGHGWAKYRTSVNEVEQLTGYTFFSRVPAEIIGPLKEKVDQEHIPAARRRKTED